MKRRTGAFTLSLDCEGLWGMADNLKVVNANIINSASLALAYDTLLSTLDKNQIKSTAAFVTCFASPFEALVEQKELLNSMAQLNPIWFKNIIQALETQKTEGWSGNLFYKQFCRYDHEIAWHGTTHQCLGDTTQKASIDLELELTSKLLGSLGTNPQTVIFPRNQVGHLDSLSNYGFKTYREGRTISKVGRVANLLNEFNVVSKGSMVLPKFQNHWNVSPSGFFFNWPSGARAIVPDSVTIGHWQSMLKHTAQNGGYLHMWFHPHNVITAPRMINTFKSVMGYVGELIKSGDLVSITMNEANHYFK